MTDDRGSMTDDRNNMFQFGRIVFAHGKEWQIVAPLRYGYAIAVPVGATTPCEVTLIKEETK